MSLNKEEQDIIDSAKHLQLLDRFWAKVNKNGPIPANKPCDGSCWEWTAYNMGGYGQFRDGKKNVYAHRFAWKIMNGPIPKDLLICHLCDNAKCVRPTHLYAGTATENRLDQTNAKWRHLRPNIENYLDMAEAIVISDVFAVSSRMNHG